MAAGVFKLSNLTAIVDMNGLQATGAVRDRFDSSPYREKFEGVPLACSRSGRSRHRLPASCVPSGDSGEGAPDGTAGKDGQGEGLRFCGKRGGIPQRPNDAGTIRRCHGLRNEVQPMKISNQRTVYGETLIELGKRDPRIVVLEADLEKVRKAMDFRRFSPSVTLRWE